MKITIIGAGYVGLVTGACFAELGNDVTCVDIDKGKVSKLNNGVMPIYEPGLKEVISKNKPRLRFTADLNGAIKNSEIIFICVGTPPKKSGEADLSYVEGVAKTIAEAMDSYKLIVEKSTVPVETGKKVMETIRAYNSHGAEFDVVSNPEFLREGSAVHDFMNPDRIVIGAETERARKAMEKLYAPLKAPIMNTDIKSAEIIKHASNSFLAAKISFINAVANICEITGADVEKVAEGMGMDRRIGKSFLNAGIGYGGFCFPKDVEAFVNISRKLGYDFRMLKEVQSINNKQKEGFIKKIEKSLWVIKDKSIGVLGLSFKPNTDDMRFAPSVDIIRALLSEGAKIKAYDPEAMENSRKLIRNAEYCSDPYEAAKDCDALIILTEWDEFKKMDIGKIKSALKNPLIIDGRNIFSLEYMQGRGIRYISMGRREVQG